jgi:hypothetical protein
VRIANGLWRTVTDFGVTVFDSAGQRISDGPVDYPIGRKVVELDSSSIGQLVDVELFPAFALETGSGDWSADVRLSFQAREPQALQLQSSGPDNGVSIVPSGNVLVSFVPPSDGLPLPDDFEPLVEVKAGTEGGVAAVWRGPAVWSFDE